MNEQQQEQIAQKIMSEIVRLQNKLVEGGFSNKTVVAETKTEVINDKLVYTDELKIGNTVLASATRIDPRPLADIKLAMQEEKTKVQAQANELVAKVDEVIAVVEPKVKK